MLGMQSITILRDDIKNLFMIVVEFVVQNIFYL
jgi:hypothetical protein